jgi:pseudouridine kinase
LSQKPYIVVVGGMNIDIQAKCFLPYKPGDSNPGSLKSFPGGVGRNIAENLVRLGARVELVSVLGDDEPSSRLSESCASLGIGLEGALRLRDSPASQYVCLLDSDGSLAGAIAAMDSMDRLSPAYLVQRALLLDSADMIVVDANIPESSIDWLAERYPKGAGRPLLGFDPVSGKKAARGRRFLGAFAFAKPNRAEAALLAGLGDSPPSILAAALRARGLGEAFISLGAEGMWAEGPGRVDVSVKGAADAPESWIARLPSRPPLGLETVNASGAGDAACAAIAWGLLGGFSLGERCSLAVAAALLAAASESPVNPDMDAALLLETAKGIERERVS